MTPIENTRGGSLASSPGRGDDVGVNAQEVRPIDRIDRPRDMGAIRSSTRPSRRVVGNRGGDRVIKGSIRARLMIGLAAIAVIATACSSSGASSALSGAAAKQYKIGYSNGGGVGNGFREEQVCTAKAQAKAAGIQAA